MSTEYELADQAQVLLVQGQFGPANTLAQQALKLNLGTPRAHLVLIDAAQAQGDLEKAKALAVVAIAAMPANPWPRIRLARLFVLLGSPSQAVDVMQAAIQNCDR